MRVTIAVFDDRVSPVVPAHTLLVVDVEGGREVRREQQRLRRETPHRRMCRIANLGTAVFVCSDISRPLEGILTRRGVEVVSHVSGQCDDVLKALLAGAWSSRLSQCRTSDEVGNGHAWPQAAIRK